MYRIYYRHNLYTFVFQDRIIFYRLEHICYCVETGRWRMSHRSHQNDYGLTSTPNISVPGTPGSGSQDYAVEEVAEHC